MDKLVATLTIHGAAEQDPKDIANWLREQAKALLKDSKKYSKRFTARYYVN
jgi:hypothetical protein